MAARFGFQRFAVFEPLHRRRRRTVRLAVERHRLVARHHHVHRVLGDARILQSCGLDGGAKKNGERLILDLCGLKSVGTISHRRVHLSVV